MFSTIDCRAGGILCNNTGVCGHTSWICDGIPDCEDGEDEMGCGGIDVDNSRLDHPIYLLRVRSQYRLDKLTHKTVVY